MDKCEWIFCESYDMDGGHWDTGCDHAYTIMEGTPKENNMKYCTFCGKEIKEVEEAKEPK